MTREQAHQFLFSLATPFQDCADAGDVASDEDKLIALVDAERERCALSVEKELTERGGPNWARVVAQHIRSGK